MAYGELEIGLHRRDAEHYQVELRYTPPGSEGEVRVSAGDARFDLMRLRELEADPAAYGRELGLALLGRSQNRPDWVLLGLGGALLHVWNHSIFKSLLFLNATSAR